MAESTEVQAGCVALQSFGARSPRPRKPAWIETSLLALLEWIEGASREHIRLWSLGEAVGEALFAQPGALEDTKQICGELLANPAGCHEVIEHADPRVAHKLAQATLSHQPSSGSSLESCALPILSRLRNPQVTEEIQIHRPVYIAAQRPLLKMWP